MRAYMLARASIIAQPIESRGNKFFFSTTMQGNYAGFAQSVVAIVDFFARQALAGSWHAGLVSAWSPREGPPGAPGRRVGLDRQQRHPLFQAMKGGCLCVASVWA